MATRYISRPTCSSYVDTPSLRCEASVPALKLRWNFTIASTDRMWRSDAVISEAGFQNQDDYGLGLCLPGPQLPCPQEAQSHHKAMCGVFWPTAQLSPPPIDSTDCQTGEWTSLLMIPAPGSELPTEALGIRRRGKIMCCLNP